MIYTEGGIKSDQRKTLHFFTIRVNSVMFQNSFERLWRVQSQNGKVQTRF